jgi:hypothetical protein
MGKYNMLYFPDYFLFNIEEYTMSNQVSGGLISWKGVIIAAIITVCFFGLFYLAMKTDPDYMPSQQHKKMQHSQTESSDVTTTHSHHGH